MNLRCAALNTGPDFHLLDHIAPLAELMQMPLIVTEEKNFDLARVFYPQVKLEYMPDLEFKLGNLAENFDALFECKYWAPHLKALFKQLYQKEMRLIFCPHGQSDKGFKVPLLAPYAYQDAVLLYGDLMIEMLKNLEIWPSISNYALIGNYRLSFYEKYRAFYDRIAESEVFSKLDPKKRTLFYAPTWSDADLSTSFFTFGKQIISDLPSDWNLLIKLHPLLEQRNPAQYYSVAAAAEKKAGVYLVSEFPPIYPLLGRVDAYLGDFSSVGYDFLNFEKPLFFLPTSESGRLHSCGVGLDPNTDFYLTIDRQLSHACQGNQKELYQFAFGKTRPQEQARQSILSLFRNKGRENKKSLEII